MTEKYDCTKDVRDHQERVRYWLNDFATQLQRRAEIHDNSKLEEPEKQVFDEYTPKLKELVFGSDEYKAALTGMGEGLKHHYQSNRHHPEHYKNGVNGMTLPDIIEMVSDWMAAAQAKKTHIDLAYLAKRFGLSEQLVEIIANTFCEEDVWNEINGVPVGYFCPPEMRDRHVEGFEKCS